jgi:hypothetical protein
MLPPPVQRAESLLADVVSILYAAFRANNDSEDYIRSLVLLKIRERLDELRALKNSANRVGPVQRGARPTRRLRLPPVGANLLPPSAEGIIHRMFGFADERLAEAVDALGKVDFDIAQRYLETAAEKDIDACLLLTRARETPSERAALIAEVNTIRESAGREPLDGEQVTAAPGAGLLRRGVGERRAPGERQRPRALDWRYPQLCQGDRRPSRRPGVTKWRQPAYITRRRYR